MFFHKQKKRQSTTKLITLLTRRASITPLKVKNGIYNDWPSQSKPSLINAAQFMKKLYSCTNQAKIKKQKISQKLKKQAASFSTCTTIQFFPSGQSTKMTSTPQTLQKETLNQTFNENNQIPEQEYEQVQLNSRYRQDKNAVELQNQNDKKGRKYRRQVKTAFVTRHIIQNNSDKIEINKMFRKSQSVKRPRSTKYSLNRLKQRSEQKTTLNQSSVSTLMSYRLNGQQYQYEQPLRLKDYETNFQAYKLMSKIIDQQMKWQPKRKRPNTSIKFRLYNY